MIFRVANVNVEIEGLKESNNSFRMELFHSEEKIVDAVFKVQYVEYLDKKKVEGLCIYSDTQFAVILKNNRKFYYYRMNGSVYAIVEELRADYYIMNLDNSFFQERIHPYFIPSLLSLERLLLLKDAFVLHSSYISIEGKAVLFTAPSGGGKSTQAELWKKYRNARIINGDKSIVGKKTDKWFAYGIPFSGSSDYCVNETNPLSAIVILEKGTENRLMRMGVRGFARIFSQVTVNPWDSKFCNRMIDLVTDACNHIPVFRYSCTKDKTAVDVLHNEFVNEGVLHGTRK